MALKHKKTEIELNRQSTMISLAKAKELEKKDQMRKKSNMELNSKG